MFPRMYFPPVIYTASSDVLFLFFLFQKTTNKMVRFISFQKTKQNKKPQTQPTKMNPPQKIHTWILSHKMWFFGFQGILFPTIILVTSSLCLLSVACRADTLSPNSCSKYFSVVFRPVPKPSTVLIIFAVGFDLHGIVLLACYVCLCVNLFLFFSSQRRDL